jgi:hypothetical protein
MNSDVDTKQWTPAVVKNIQILGRLSFGYKWMHTKAAKEFAKRYRYLIHTCSILSGISAALLLLETVFVRPNYPNTYIVPIIAGFFNILTTILSETINATDYQELSGDHQAFAAKYTSLISSIQRQLTLDCAYRENASAYLSWIAKDYDQLFELAPLVRSSFIKAYTKVAEKKGWPIPEETLLEMCATDIVNRDDDVPIVLHHPSVNVNERLEALQNTSVPEIFSLPSKDHMVVDMSSLEDEDTSSSPLSVVNSSPDWSPRKQPSGMSSNMSVGTSRTPSGKDKKFFKKKPVSNKVVVEVNRFNDQRMQFELDRLRQL